MSYKTDSEKGFKLLKCLSVPIIIVVGPFGVGKTDFASKFKSEGYSVLNLGKNKSQIDKTISAHLAKSKNMLVMIEVNISNPEELNKLLTNYMFSLVYLYPNSGAKYKSNVESKLKQDDLKLSDNEMELQPKIEEYIKTRTGLTKIVSELMKKNNETYEKYLEFFEDKLLTVLI